LTLWRGDALADLADCPFVAVYASRLEEVRLTAVEGLIDARLALGEQASVVVERDDLVGRYPLREKIHGQRMLALYRAGRQAEALAAYRTLHRVLDDELGVEPSTPLQRLHQAMLSHDPVLAAPSVAPAVAGAAAAERAFHAAEPEDRLVVRTLETRWETKLTALADAEAALAASQATTPPLPARTDLEALIADLPGLWAAPTTTARDRKRLLRTLIADVTVLPEPDPDKVRIAVRWHTGATDEILTTRPLPPGPASRTPAAAVELIRGLGPTTSNDDLVAELNTAGLHTGHGRPFDIDAVQWVRHLHNFPVPSPYLDGELSVTDAARRLQVSTGTVYYWINNGHSPPAAAVATGSASHGPATSKPHASAAPPSPHISITRPNTFRQEGQYEITVPTVADRIAQTVVALTLEPRTEAIFHRDSYGYRPGRSAHQVLAACRQRCWKKD
jgi:hypothetical protein